MTADLRGMGASSTIDYIRTAYPVQTWPQTPIYWLDCKNDRHVYEFAQGKHGAPMFLFCRACGTTRRVETPR